MFCLSVSSLPPVLCHTRAGVLTPALLCFSPRAHSLIPSLPPWIQLDTALLVLLQC